VEDSAVRQSILVLLIVGCGGQTPAASHTDPPPTETGSLGAATTPVTATADTTTVRVPLSLPSQLYVERDATIYSRSPGIVETILVDLGAQVSKGQPMARLESADQRIALDQAQDRFENTRRDLDRQRALKAAGVVTQADSERVEFEHREAVLALAKAQRDYDLTLIASPFSGVVTGRMARLHRLVNAGDSLFRVTALKPVLATIHVPEAYAAGVTVGSQAEVVGMGGATAKARIIRASPMVDAASGTREMVLELNPGTPGLAPGASVTVRLGTDKRQVVAIPRSAVGKDGYVLVWEGDRSTLRAITRGSELPDDLIEVVSGLAPGERVLRNAP
jgi:membrane fusion protein (multidrug efflux system)